MNTKEFITSKKPLIVSVPKTTQIKTADQERKPVIKVNKVKSEAEAWDEVDQLLTDCEHFLSIHRNVYNSPILDEKTRKEMERLDKLIETLETRVIE